MRLLVLRNWEHDEEEKERENAKGQEEKTDTWNAVHVYEDLNPLSATERYEQSPSSG
jgi:hypothetical protein